MRGFFCETLVEAFFISHQLRLNQLILNCTDRGKDCFQNRQISAGFLVFHVFFHLLFIICLTHVHSVSFRFIIIWTCLFWFLCMCGFPGLSLTSGENFPSIAPLKIYLLKKKEKNVDMFNTYFHYMLHLMPPPPKKGWNSCIETGEKSSFIHFLNCSSSWGWCRAAACSSCHWARMDRLPVFSRVNLTANYVH